jgi:hypothetical protein
MMAAAAVQAGTQPHQDGRAPKDAINSSKIRRFCASLATDDIEGDIAFYAREQRQADAKGVAGTKLDLF